MSGGLAKVDQRLPPPAKDNRNEVYKTYLWVVALSTVFVFAQIPIFYIPSLRRSKQALSYLRKTDFIDLGEVKDSDAIWYGSYLQSAAEFDTKAWMFSLWMIFCHALLIAMGYLSEIIYARMFKHKSYYQDVTLEFKFLSDRYDDEDKIVRLFQLLTSGNVREVSLLYDLSEYYTLKRQIDKVESRIKEEGLTPALALKKETTLDRLNSFKGHFLRYKKGYFLNRGYITLASHKMAFEMKELCKKAFGDREPNTLDKILNKFKTQTPVESAIRRRFRQIVLNKVIAPRSQTKDPLTRAVKLLFGSSGSVFHKKINLLRQEAGDHFVLNRGIAAEDINWSYVPEEKINTNQIILLFVIVLIVIPLVMFGVAVVFYGNTIENMKGAKRGAYGFVVDKLLFTSMLGIDQISLLIIDKMLPTHKFLKEHQAISLKFISTNLYFLSSGLFFLFLGLVVAANDKMSSITSMSEQFRITKQVLDSFYMTFLALIIVNLNSIIFMPVYKYTFQNKGVPVPRDITHTLSFMCMAIYYVGFFAPFDINIIPVMGVSMLVLLIGEITLWWRGIVTPMRVNFSIIGVYLLALIWGLLPVTLSAYLMLSGNKMGIRTLKLDGKNWLLLSLLVLAYGILAAVCTVLYSNERLLRRIQTRIWTVNESEAAPKELLGNSYRVLNPVYNFEEKLKAE